MPRRRIAAKAGLALIAALLCGSALSASAARHPVARRAAARHPAARRAAPAPAIVHDYIPIGPRRTAETRAYAKRHYGIVGSTLIGPHVIVEHFSGSETYQSVHNTFLPDVPDSELGELPGLCAQFVVDRNGRIYQQTSVRFMCRHTVGLNWTAIGIEHVGSSDAEILADHRQLTASIALTRWLQAVYAIPTVNVIGHNESLRSRYHCEHVAALRDQTHDDWNRADMRIYRRLLGPGPPGSSPGAGADQHAASCAARLGRTPS
jgi:beta-N-acetylhexosaminidase